MREDWSRAEVDATVAAYLDMLDHEVRGAPFNKSEVRRRLLATLNARSEGAIERKHQNISAILIELGLPPVRGYKPLSNYQRLLYDVVRERLLHAPGLLAAIRARAEQPIIEPPTSVDDLLGRLVEPPDASERYVPSSTTCIGSSTSATIPSCFSSRATSPRHSPWK
ncbi:MAG: hypothetical protein ACXW2P_12660 [Thermoanaerobaculia bacterium]